MRRDLVERSVELCRMLRRLLPRDPAVAGLLVLLLTDARRETRTAPDGRLLLLEEQDRTRWDRAAIAEGVALVREALQARPPSRYALQAAIAAGLAALDALSAEPQLAGYGYLPAARADLLRRLGRVAEAEEAYTEALLLTENTVERAFLERRLRETGG